jgi:hypothetical protein
LTCATRTQTPIPTPACAGDCNADGRVDISELVQGVRAALGASGEEPCLFAFDRDRTETLGINELIAAVSSALTGCAEPADPRPAACRDSGGVVGSRHCCVGVDDFPDTCTNTCGLCPPNATDVVASCACGVDRCFDGSSCVDDVTTRTPTPTFDPRTPTPTPTVDDSVLPCLQTGGTSSSAMCCLGAASFPKTCGVDPCACPLNVSHLISVCDCGPQRCYDPGRGGCVDVIEPVVAGLERVVEQQCTWTSPGPFLREVSVTDQGYAIECDSASGHASHAELVRYESVDQARVAFAYAAMDRERIEFHQLAAAYWSVPINMGRGGGDRYLVWRLGCWVITAHTFDDTDFRIAAQPVPFSEAILAEAGDSLLAECGSD